MIPFLCVPQHGGGSPIPPLGMGRRLPWQKNWPGGTYSVPVARKVDPKFTVATRQQRRRASMTAAVAEMGRRFGGESRRHRRAMGIALGKRMLHAPQGKAARA